MGAHDTYTRRIDDLIAAVTRRLKPDAELQMDVANELRAHLEDAARAAREEGLDEDAARETALKSFGDADALENAIFHANLRRMRVRRVIKWVARLAVLPAALLLATWLCLGSWRSLSGILELTDVSRHVTIIPPIRPELRYRGDLTPNERLLRDAFAADDDAKSLVTCFPDDPVYRAHRLCRQLQRLETGGRDALDAALRSAEIGEKLEPDNAMWSYVKAALLLRSAGVSRPNTDALPICDPLSGHGDVAGAPEASPVPLPEPALPEPALAAYRAAVAKPRYVAWRTEIVRRRLALCVPPHRLEDEFAWLEAELGYLFPDGFLIHKMQDIILATACRLAADGRTEEAVALLRVMPATGAQIAASADLALGLIFGHNLRAEAFKRGGAVFRSVGLEADAVAAFETAAQEEAYIQGLIAESSYRDFPHRGLLDSVARGPFRLRDEGAIRVRRAAEHMAAERIGLGALALAMLLIALWMGGSTACAMWRHRRDTRGPKLFFVGWARLACAVAVTLAPLLLYAAWTRNPWFGRLQYGVVETCERGVLEMVGVAVAVVSLSVWSAARAARARCREAGVALPVRRAGCVTRAVHIGLATIALAGLALYVRQWPHPHCEGFGYALAAYLVLAAGLSGLIAALAGGRRTPAEREGALAVRRGMLPVIVACLLAVGLVAHFHLAASEARKLTAARSVAAHPVLDEVDLSVAADYRAYFRALPNQGALAPPTEGGANAE